MRDLIVTENITLDGVIEATEGWFDPPGGEDDVSDVEAALRKQREAADALLLGRVTFEQMRGYWPLQTDDTTGITDYLNGVSKYVVSSTLQDPEWERTAVLRSVDDIGALKSEAGGDIVTTGSIRLVREFIAAELVDSTGSSPIQSCSGAANGHSRTRPRSRACVWSRASPFAPASCSCATAQADGASASRCTASAFVLGSTAVEVRHADHRRTYLRGPRASRGAPREPRGPHVLSLDVWTSSLQATRLSRIE